MNIEFNKTYTTKGLANALDVSYSTLRNHRKEYEHHLSLFYDYETSYKGNSICYTFTAQRDEFIPYKEYKKIAKNKLLQESIIKTIHYDNRQTGSNIARIIIVDGKIQALGLQLTTLKVYVRDNLRELLEQGYYVKTDYRWCYLDKKQNKYLLMTDDDIKVLRSYFHTKEQDEAEENIWTKVEEGEIKLKEAEVAVGKLRINGFIQGRMDFSQDKGYWPMKVPVYERANIYEKG